MRRTSRVLATVILLVLAIGTASHHFSPAARVVYAREPAPSGDPVATFSILGFDPALRAAMDSRVLSIGVGDSPADAGAVAAQAVVDSSHGARGFELLRRGFPPDEVALPSLEGEADPWTELSSATFDPP